MNQPRTVTVMFDRAPATAEELDARLATPCLAVITAPPPARAALARLCAERGVPCVVTAPLSSDPRDEETLARSPARVVPRWPALAGHAFSHAIRLLQRGSLGARRAVSVRAREDEASAIEAMAVALVLLAREGDVVLESAGARWAELRADSGARARVDLEPDADGLFVAIEGALVRAEIHAREDRDALAVVAGSQRHEVSLPGETPVAVLLARARGEKTLRAELSMTHALRAHALYVEAWGGKGDRAPRTPDAADAGAWSAATSAAVAARTPREALLAAGLEPDVEIPLGVSDAMAAPPALDVEALEALAFDAGIKPALYLTLPREKSDEVRARYAHCHVESVEYTLLRDPLSDARTRVNARGGERGTHVDLFVSREPGPAARAAEIYRDPRGPSDYLAEMGSLLGYPACCVAAFASLPDRSNNSATRHACRERTAALGFAFASELNNLFAHVVPFFPCSYACPRALAHARAVLDAYAERKPAGAASLREALAAPVLYADHARALGLAGAAWDGGVLRYERVIARGEATGAAGLFRAGLAAVLARGDGLRDAGERWEVVRGGAVVATMTRRAPDLLRVFPFGV